MRGSWHTAFRFMLGLIAGSLVFELYLRTMEATPLWRVLPVAEASLYSPSRDAGYTHRAGASGVWITENRTLVAINRLGLRDALDRTHAKPSGARRFAVVGDSIVEAVQVPLEETFVARTQAELRKRGHGAVEVVNLGLAGARPAVIVERLRFASQALDLDGAVVSVSAGDFLVEAEDDASEIAGYVRGPDGRAVISHAFREGRGFMLRTSAIGDRIYWAIDHIRLALVLNNRKNAGLTADLVPRPTARTAAVDDCSEEALLSHEALWRGRGKGFSNDRLQAFLADLASIASQKRVQLVVALRDLPAGCPVQVDFRRGVVEAADALVGAAGLTFVDHEMAMDAHLAGRTRSNLRGFGSRVGIGHLNSDGHSVYAGVTTDVIATYLLARR